jgi:DtxR family Mn-dependent transcriptional regulator
LASTLNIHAVSANQMIRKLEEYGIVNYQPYKGVVLKEEGMRFALRLIRNRRLWEVFLVQHLELPLDQADRLACGLEHLTDHSVCARLAAFLDNPVFDAHGRLIPECQYEDRLSENWFPMNKAQVGDMLLVRQMKADSPTRAFLAGEGLFPGAVIKLVGKGETSGYLLQLNNHHFMIDEDIAAHMMVRKENSQEEK